MRLLIVVLAFLGLLSCSHSSRISQMIPSTFLGTFEDDYGIEYRISPTQFIQEPRIIYNILEWNSKEQYIITQNAATNPSEPNLFTRIDYVALNNMEPFSWGFCYTTYNAASASMAKATAAADKTNPKIGCGGYPFSRMKKMD